MKRLLILATLLVWADLAFAQLDTLCAEVKMQIAQEVTLERQAFDAQMRIRNGLPDLPLTDVAITLTIEDIDGNDIAFTSDPNDTNALFYVAAPVLLSVDSIAGTGTVAASSSAQINWLIIPAPGAAGVTQLGKRYFVGASFSYELNGAAQTLNVAPDFIYVRPMPRLTLDYFLPKDVYGDDPLSAEKEPIVPFPLGVRVRNLGVGSAFNLRIDSGQPDIIENKLGLLVAFQITSSDVNGVPSPETLRVDFGDLEGGASAVARWWMTASLSGTFSNFTAEFAHADELGGELTSLIDDVFTHTLIHPVLVDLPGRDSAPDFLADEGPSLRVYESDGTEAATADLSGSSTIQVVTTQIGTETYTITIPATAGPLHVKMPYWDSSESVVTSVRRSDGKRLNPANVWFSRTRSSLTNTVDHFVHIFDVDGGGVYTLDVADARLIDRPPVLQPIGDRVVFATSALSIDIRADDTNGTPPLLSYTPLPAGASVSTSNDANAVFAHFTWTPSSAQVGVHPVRFAATDDGGVDTEQIRIYVGSVGEGTNAAGVPPSLADWMVPILDVWADSAQNVSTVTWSSVTGVTYDVFFSDDLYGTGMTWQVLASNVQAQAVQRALADTGLAASDPRRFYGVTLPGDTPGMQNVWGVYRRVISGAGYTLTAPPLSGDRRFDGEFGAALAAVLDGDDGGVGDLTGDEVAVLETNGTWRTLYLDTADVWRESGGAVSTYTLPQGAGFYVRRMQGSDARVTFTDPTGTPGTRTNQLNTGYSIFGPAVAGRADAIALLEAGSPSGPQGAASEELADLLIIRKPDGRWQRLMRVAAWGPAEDGRWVDIETRQILSTLDIDPGEAVLYFRAGPDMEVTF